MATNDDMADLECIHSEIKDTQKVQVCVYDHIRDVSMDEDLTWLGTNDYVCRDSAIGAPNP